jgi:hypothetical protein
MPARSTTLEFIEKAVAKHGNLYDYSLSEYKGIRDKLAIICPKHGVFYQVPNSHLRGIGCPKCGLEQRSKTRTWTLQKFMNKANKIHNFKYDYSKGIYLDSMKKILIICPEHGEFYQKVNNHLQGQGCPKCNFNHGFSRTHWIKFCNSKKNINPKVYIVRCYNNNEEFIKIGITIRTIFKRFPSKGHLPYEFEVLKEIKGSPAFVYDKENELHKLFKDFKYIPKLEFLGKTECFNIEILDKIKSI